jgi:hypothetical protein
MITRRSIPASLASLLAAALSLASLSCASLAPAKSSALIIPSSSSVEVGKELSLSLRLAMPGGAPEISWSAGAGEILPTLVDNEVDFRAPEAPGEVTVSATARSGGRVLRAEVLLKVLPLGALKRTIEVIVEVDCASLKKVWVDEAHPSEDFAPPLKIKGTFALDVDTGEASAGGSWPTYDMYDDGTHGDRAAGDGVWSERFVFPKTGAKVYFAFDDGNAYRVGFESGLAWRLKLAWRGVDEAGAGEVSDANNLFFVPDRDQVVKWTADMAARSGMFSRAAK